MKGRQYFPHYLHSNSGVWMKRQIYLKYEALNTIPVVYTIPYNPMVLGNIPILPRSSYPPTSEANRGVY